MKIQMDNAERLKRYLNPILSKNTMQCESGQESAKNPDSVIHRKYIFYWAQASLNSLSHGERVEQAFSGHAGISLSWVRG
jgi:hypothetical protein